MSTKRKFVIPFLGHAVYAALLLIALQLFGLIDLPQWAVFVPFTIPAAVMLLTLVLALGIALAEKR